VAGSASPGRSACSGDGRRAPLLPAQSGPARDAHRPVLDLFLGGLRHASRKFQCALAGGDTTRRDEILINITVVGEVRAGSAVLRSGARPGDILYVSGRLGEAELGLQIVRRTKGAASKNNPLTRSTLPGARLALGQWLSKRLGDRNDGPLRWTFERSARLCAASAVGARLEKAKIPRVKSPDLALKHGRDPLQLALHGGTTTSCYSPCLRAKQSSCRRPFEVWPHPIGKITRERVLLMLAENGRASQLIPSGWDPSGKGSSHGQDLHLIGIWRL